MKYDIWNQLGIHRFCFVQCILLLDHDVSYMCGLIGPKHAVIEHYGGGLQMNSCHPLFVRTFLAFLGIPLLNCYKGSLPNSKPSR